MVGAADRRLESCRHSPAVGQPVRVPPQLIAVRLWHVVRWFEHSMKLTPEQWESVKELFHAAVERPGAERASFLLMACHESTVRQEVERLLANYSASSSFISCPLPASANTSLSMQFLSPGDVLADRFRILRFLASGGMGEVYEAEDIELRESVALKTVRPDLLCDGHSLRPI